MYPKLWNTFSAVSFCHGPPIFHLAGLGPDRDRARHFAIDGQLQLGAPPKMEATPALPWATDDLAYARTAAVGLLRWFWSALGVHKKVSTSVRPHGSQPDLGSVSGSGRLTPNSGPTKIRSAEGEARTTPNADDGEF